LTLLGIGLL